jgi:hypothetical protein
MVYLRARKEPVELMRLQPKTNGRYADGDGKSTVAKDPPRAAKPQMGPLCARARSHWSERLSRFLAGITPANVADVLWLYRISDIMLDRRS